jgi:hypothetical protein
MSNKPQGSQAVRGVVRAVTLPTGTVIHLGGLDPANEGNTHLQNTANFHFYFYMFRPVAHKLYQVWREEYSVRRNT